MFCSADTDAQLKTISEGWKAALSWEPDPCSVGIPCPAADLLVPIVAQGRAGSSAVLVAWEVALLLAPLL